MRSFEGMSADRLGELIERFPRLRIAVLGDFFLDKYLDVDPGLAEVSVETGKTAHQVVGIRHSPGAAGTVVCNLSALGAGTLHAVGFTGDDGQSYELRKDLGQLRCGTDHLHHDPLRMTPTYLKPRDKTDPSLSGEHQRYDTKNRSSTSGTIEQQIVDSLDALLPELDAVIVADQVEEEECGAITARVREALAQRAGRHPGVVFWADSRRRIRQFRGMIIKPNQFEAVGKEDPLPGDEVALVELAEALQRLRTEIAAPICATRGADGMLVSDPEMTAVPGVHLEGPIDPTGAGDSATAGAVLALAAGAELPEAALVGNLVASITVEQLATTGTARPDQLFQRLQMWSQQREGAK
ncbi:MAG: bifunctional heptose 7-phosphate kinase/heptose 1-phosphate adenyltransferase [Planctomycetota bacterium]|jgi:rfaE bifunctional protein kinase chain/domain